MIGLDLNRTVLESLSRVLTSSWALWNDSGPNDMEFFAQNIFRLHGRVVLLGLNRSDAARGAGRTPFMNFHSPDHRGDRRLRNSIQGAGLANIVGAYMTDLSELIETDSNRVEIPSPADAVERLRSQLAELSEEERTIICLGNKTFRNLCMGIGLTPSRYSADEALCNLRVAEAQFERERWTIYRVWMPSNYGANQRRGEVELPEQLRLIDEMTGRVE